MALDLPLSALGAAIRAKRLERGLSQTALAARCGRHPTYLSGVEHGSRNPSFAILAAIAAALDVPLSQLMADAEALARSR